MCIICNTKDHQTGDAFLFAFDSSRRAMALSAKAMLACSEDAIGAESRERYARVHKQMVRLIREWNRIEQTREGDGT